VRNFLTKKDGRPEAAVELQQCSFYQ